MTPNQFRNILAFIVLMFGEFPAEILTGYSPEYIVEKYLRYIGQVPPDDDRWNWGHHPTLRRVIDAYVAKWELEDPDMCKLLSREPS